MRSFTCCCVLVFSATLGIPLPATNPESVQALPAAAALTATEQLFAPASLRGCSLSPSGKKVAWMFRFDDSHYALRILDLGSQKMDAMIVADDAALVEFWWKTDEVILVSVSSAGGSRFRTLDVSTGGWTNIRSLWPFRDVKLVNLLRGRPDDMLFSGTRSTGFKALLRINWQKDKLALDSESKSTAMFGWVATLTGETVAAWGLADHAYYFETRDGLNGKWTRVQSEPYDPLTIFPLSMAPDHRRLLVVDYRNSDLGVVGALDLTSGKVEKLAASPRVEPGAVLKWGPDMDAAGVAFDADPWERIYFNPEAQAFEDWLRTKLPGMQTQVESVSADGTKAIVQAWSARSPGIYCLVDIPARSLKLIGSAKPELQGATLIGSSHFEFTARDGQKISGRITLPDVGPRPPMVVLIRYGRTASRSLAVFDPEAEFFARLGYAAVRIDHRGIEGYGHRFTAAANFHIHDTVVHDIVDGVAWLRAQGWVDPQRAAVYGERTAGWIAFQLATGATPFKVLLNECSPLSADLLVSDIFTTKGLIGYGPNAQARNYEESLVPLKVADKLSTVSFHGYSPGYPVETLQAVLKKGREQYEVFVSKPSDESHVPWVEWKEKARRLDAMAAFLAKHL